MPSCSRSRVPWLRVSATLDLLYQRTAMRRGTQPPMDDDLRKCFRSLLQRVEFESLCCRKKIEESERVRRRIREEREAERPPQLRGHDRVRQYAREEREVERPTPSRSAPRAAPTRPASTGRAVGRAAASTLSAAAYGPTSPRQAWAVNRRPHPAWSPSSSPPRSVAASYAAGSPGHDNRRVKALESAVEELQSRLAVEKGLRMSLESQLPLEAANTKQAKAALAGVQKKLGQMEDAVIRLTGEKDALAHRMKSLRVVNGQLLREVEALKQRIAEDEAERQKSHRLTELQNKTVIMSMQQYVSGKLDVAKRQVRDARARVRELESLCVRLGMERDAALRYLPDQPPASSDVSLGGSGMAEAAEPSSQQPAAGQHDHQQQQVIANMVRDQLQRYHERMQEQQDYRLPPTEYSAERPDAQHPFLGQHPPSQHEAAARYYAEDGFQSPPDQGSEWEAAALPRRGQAEVWATTPPFPAEGTGAFPAGRVGPGGGELGGLDTAQHDQQLYDEILVLMRGGGQRPDDVEEVQSGPGPDEDEQQLHADDPSSGWQQTSY